MRFTRTTTSMAVVLPRDKTGVETESLMTSMAMSLTTTKTRILLEAVQDDKMKESVSRLLEPNS